MLRHPRGTISWWGSWSSNALRGMWSSFLRSFVYPFMALIFGVGAVVGLQFVWVSWSASQPFHCFYDSQLLLFFASLLPSHMLYFSSLFTNTSHFYNTPLALLQQTLRDTSGPTVSCSLIPLHFAPSNKHTSVVRALLLHGSHTDTLITMCLVRRRWRGRI